MYSSDGATTAEQDGAGALTSLTDLRESEFNVVAVALDGRTRILFNTRTTAYLTLSEAAWRDWRSGNYDRCDDVPRLIRMGLLVSNRADERKMVRDAYFRTKRTSGNLSLTVSPSVSCNFRCGYCFQEHPNRHFTPDDIQRVSLFAQSRLSVGGRLGVTWFGGEPLVRKDTLFKLQSALALVCKIKGASFSQSIITNGSLLTPEVARRLCDNGPSEYVQVTLDGGPQTHNQRRPTVGGKGTFSIIIRNLTDVAALLPITIRINVERRNASELPTILEHLENAGLRGKVSVYLGHVESYTAASTVPDEAKLSREEYASIQIHFSILLANRGWPHHSGLPTRRDGALCTADSPEGYVVSPGSLLFRCWNEAADSLPNAWGTIADSGTLMVSSDAPNDSRPQLGPDYDPFKHEQCRGCRVQPLCRGGCPWEAEKRPMESTGHCTPLRWNLGDKLRLWHLANTARQGATD